MSIIYTLIAKEHEKVLCEFTEYHGNFQVITRNLIKKLKEQSKAVVVYDDMYLFYFISSSTANLTYLCMCENTFPYQSAFEFLEGVRDDFEHTYTADAIASAYAYTFNKDFGNVLENKMHLYNATINVPPTNQSLPLQKAHENVLHFDDLAKPSNRDDKAALIVKRFKLSDEDGQSFLEGALKVRKRLTRKKKRRYVTILLMLLVIGYLMSVVVCGGVALPRCVG